MTDIECRVCGATVCQDAQRCQACGSEMATGETPRSAKVRNATLFLAAWGAFNAIAWVFTVGGWRQLLNQLSQVSGNSHPNSTFILPYGGLILGVLMLAFAVFGHVTRSPNTILLSGISLVAVGVFNAGGELLLDKLTPPGYVLEGPSVFGGAPVWLMLGLLQTVWGFQQIISFWAITASAAPRMAPPKGEMAGMVIEVLSPGARAGRSSLVAGDESRYLAGSEIVSAGRFHTVGLRTDGTAVAVGNNNFGQCDVSSWSDLVAVSAGDAHTVGLSADGTVVVVGRNEEGQCTVSKWQLATKALSGSLPPAPPLDAFCLSCGTPLDPLSDVFCPKCGRAQVPTP